MRLRKYIGTYYHTKLGAIIAMEIWRIGAYIRVWAKGDKVLRDNSHVTRKPVWKHDGPMWPDIPNSVHSISETNIRKWFVFKGIWTREFYNDIQNMKPFCMEEFVKSVEEEIKKDDNRGI